MQKKREKQPRDLSLPMEGFARPAQVAHAFGVSRATLYNYIKDGKIPKPEKDGERISRWPVSVIRECLKKQGGSVFSRQVSLDNPPMPAS